MKPYIEHNGKTYEFEANFTLKREYDREYQNRLRKAVDDWKAETNIGFALYGTPAESLCGLQVEQFRKMYGIIENVSDKPYVSNSFHCHVSENMSPIEKQDKEERKKKNKKFFQLFFKNPLTKAGESAIIPLLSEDSRFP